MVYLDALVVRSRAFEAVQHKTVYLALGVNMDGEKERLGLWMAQTEGAKFWLSVMTELKNRGVQDILISCVDGLKGSRQPLKLSIRRPKYSSESYIRCATRCVMSAGSSVRNWLATYV